MFDISVSHGVTQKEIIHRLELNECLRVLCFNASFLSIHKYAKYTKSIQMCECGTVYCAQSGHLQMITLESLVTGSYYS